MKKYDSYKDSGVEWIGKVPANWGISKVKFLFDTQKGKTPKNLLDKIEENSLVYLAMDYLRGEPKQVFFVSNNENVVLTEENETLLLWDGSNAGEFLKSKKGVLSSTMALIKSKIIDNQFQWYSFKSFESILKDSCNGMGIPHVDGKFFRGSAFLVPPIEEQQAIVNYLDQKTTQIDNLITKKEQFIKLLEEERVAVINQAVTKGLDPNVSMKDSGIEWLGEIPKHWKVNKIKSVTNKIGSGVTPKGGAEIYELTGIPLLRSQNVYFDGFRLDNVAYITREIHDSMKNSQVLFGDVLLNITGGSIGRCYYVTNEFEEANVNQHVCIVRPNERIITEFLYYVLSSTLGQQQIDLCQTGGNREALNFEQLKNFFLILPSIDEQHEIVEKLNKSLNAISLTIEKSRKEIDLINEYKTALISEVVTGKVDVRNEKLN
ncbi:MAG: restriction endonuclease subunit S [Crocinitomicaceae bacterium]|nr:restriction endonuclease subunit S [Crocinitomicaceae bacterium]